MYRRADRLRVSLRQPGGYPLRPPAGPAPASAISASNLQLMNLARQQPSGGGAAASAPLRVTHSPHGSLHSPLSVSLGSPHPSPASTSPQAPSPLPPSAPAPAPAPAPAAFGRSSPSSEQFPIRSRANTMSPPRGGRGGRYGSRPRSCSFTLPQRPGSSASLTLPPRRAGFSIAEIMEPSAAAAAAAAGGGGETGGALDLSVRRRPAPFDDFHEDPQDSISECVSDAVERFLDDDSKLSGTAQDSGISEMNRGGLGDSAVSEPAKPSDSGSAGSKLTASVGSTGGISQPPKKRRLTLDQATVAGMAGRQKVITGYFPAAPTAVTTAAATAAAEREESAPSRPAAASATGGSTMAPSNVGPPATTATATSAPTAASGAAVSTTAAPVTTAGTNSTTAGGQAQTRTESQPQVKREW